MEFVRHISRCPSKERCSPSKQHLSSSAYYFYLGAVVNLLAWSPVLCRVTRGVVRYPDRMPTAVWIGTYGIAAFFDLFVIAQASSMTNRVRHAPECPATMSSVRFFALGEWRGIVTFGACMAFVLVSGVLYGVPSIRAWFGIHPEQQPAEPWCIMCFMVWAYFMFLLVLQGMHWVKYSVQREWEQLLICVSIGLVVFFGWGRVVMTNVHSHSELGWGIALVLSFAAVLAIHLWQVPQLEPAAPTETDRLRQPDVGPTPGATVCVGPPTVCVGAPTVCVGPPMVCVGAPMVCVGPPTVCVGPPTVGEDSSAGRGSACTGHLGRLYQAHGWAVVFHSALILWTLLIGLSVSGDYTTDYVFSYLSTYFLTTDWEYVSQMRDVLTDKFDVPYCGTDKAMPVFYLLCCCAWSAASATQHVMSCRVLRPQSGLRFDGPASLVVRATDGLPHRGGSYAGCAAVFFGLLLPVVHNYKLSANLFIAAVPIAAVAALVWYACVLAPPQLYAHADDPLTKSRMYKWIEYSFSATLMFLVVQLNSRVVSAHELVLGTGCFGVSMLLVHSVDAHLNKVHSALSREEQANDELAFVYLSFFAKGILCVALTVPVLFIEKMKYETKPVPCTPAL